MKHFASILHHARVWRPVGREALLRYAVARQRNERRRFTDADHLRAAAAWLARAQDVTGDDGVCGRYHLETEWTSSYPETTGYLIPTLLDLSGVVGLEEFRDRARRAVRFLLGIQLPSGAFPGGEVDENRSAPSAFNTAQILSGLQAWYGVERDPAVLDAARRAADWLVAIQDPDGAWRRHVYRGTPTTYTAHASCWLAAFGQFVNEDAYMAAAKRHLEWVMGYAVVETGWFDLAGFDSAAHQRREAHTHTIAYTLWGVLQTGEITGSASAFSAVERAAWGVARRFELMGRLPGVLDWRWRPRSPFQCVTGTAQMALIWCRLAELGGDARFLNVALKAVDAVKASQVMERRHVDLFGALPGSDPVWGDYVPMAFPNWAAKFLIDALLRLPKTRDAVLASAARAWRLPTDVPTALPNVERRDDARAIRTVLYAGRDSLKVAEMLQRWKEWGFSPAAIVIERGHTPNPWRRLVAMVAASGAAGLLDFARRRGWWRSRSTPSVETRTADDTRPSLAIDYREAGIPVLEVDSLRTPEAIAAVRALSPDLAIHAGAGILRQDILSVPRLGTLNAHMGVLPRYRGVNVAEWTVLEDGPVGCTVHLIDPGIDTGAIMLVRPVPTESAGDIETLRHLVNEGQLRALGDVIRWISSTGELPPVRPQRQNEGRQYFRMHWSIKAELARRLKGSADAAHQAPATNQRASA